MKLIHYDIPSLTSLSFHFRPIIFYPFLAIFLYFLLYYIHAFLYPVRATIHVLRGFSQFLQTSVRLVH